MNLDFKLTIEKKEGFFSCCIEGEKGGVVRDYASPPKEAQSKENDATVTQVLAFVMVQDFEKMKFNQPK